MYLNHILTGKDSDYTISGFFSVVCLNSQFVCKISTQHSTHLLCSFVKYWFLPLENKIQISVQKCNILDMEKSILI